VLNLVWYVFVVLVFFRVKVIAFLGSVAGDGAKASNGCAQRKAQPLSQQCLTTEKGKYELKIILKYHLFLYLKIIKGMIKKRIYLIFPNHVQFSSEGILRQSNRNFREGQQQISVYINKKGY